MKKDRGIRAEYNLKDLGKPEVGKYTNMTVEQNELLSAVLEGWDRHNRVLINLVEIIPPDGLEAFATESSPSVSQMLMHAHHERMVSVQEEVPELDPQVPATEWATEVDPQRIIAHLRQSAAVVREAVRKRVTEGRPLDQNFAHPVVLIQFLIFHEAYHHGQIKIALKVAGIPIPDDVAGPVVWSVWRDRK